MEDQKRKFFLFGLLFVLLAIAGFWFLNLNSAGESIKNTFGIDNSAELNGINRKYGEVKKMEIKTIDREKFSDLIEKKIPKKSVEEIRKGKSNPFSER